MPPEFAKRDDLDVDSKDKTPEMMRILEMRKACLDFLAALSREGWIAEDSHTEEMRYIWQSIWDEYTKTFKGEADLAQLEEKDFQLPREESFAINPITQQPWQHAMSATAYSNTRAGSIVPDMNSVFEKIQRQQMLERKEHGQLAAELAQKNKEMAAREEKIKRVLRDEYGVERND